MDFRSMKRKQLQALCKRHNIPANLSNLEMANRISEVLKGKDDPLIQRPMEGLDEHVSETESTDVIVNKNVKKVRFSPEHELIEFSRSPELKRRTRSMAVSKSVVNVSCRDMNQENLGRAGRALRSRGLKSMESNIDEKRGKNPEKSKGVDIDASAIEILDNGKLHEGKVDSSSQEMMLRGKNRYNKSAKDDGKINEKASDNIDNEKLIEKIVVNPGRLTRSRVQKLKEVSAKEENQGRKVAKRTGNVAKVIAENKENRAVGTCSFTNRGDEDEVELANDPGERGKSKGKSLEEGLENKIVVVHDVNEPQIIRRSKRNTNKVVDSEILYVNKRKNENGEGNVLRKRSKLNATTVSGVDVDSNESEVNPGRGVSSKREEPIKVEPRRSNRRKNVIEADELKAKTENGHPSRCSVPQLGTADEDFKDEKKVLRVTGRSRRKTLNVKSVSEDETKTKRVLRGSVPELGIADDVDKDEKKVLQPTNVTRRSRRKTLSVKIVSADEKAHTHLDVEKLETETENVCVLRGSVPQLGIAGEVSKDEKTILQQKGTRMLGSKTSCFTPVDEENDTNLAVEKLEAEELKTETCLVEKECYAVQQSTRRSRRIASQCKSPNEIGRDSDKVIKRKRGVIKTGNDPSSIAETMKETSSKKVVSTALLDKVAASGKRRCRLDGVKVLDASSHNELEVGEHFVAKAQPSRSEGLESTSNLGFGVNTSAEGTHGKKPDASLADNEVSSDMKLIDRREMEDSDTNAAPRNKEFKTDFTDFEDGQVSGGMEKYNLPLEIDVHELLEQNIRDMGKNDPGAHVLSETEDMGCNRKIDNQVLLEGSKISGSEGFDETGSSTDSFVHGALMEVTEAEVDGCSQPSPNVVERVGEDKGIAVEENLGFDLPRKDNQVLREGSKISEQGGLAETTSSADNPLPGDHTDFKNVEVAEIEAEICLQPNACAVGELKVIAAQENLDSDETGQDDKVLPEDPKCDNTLDNNNEDTPPIAGAFDSCERSIDYNHSKSIMNSKALSSCMLRRVEGDNMIARNEAFFHKASPELTETDDDGGLDILNSVSYRYSAFGIPDFSDGERSAKIAPQDCHEVHTDKSSNSEDGKTVEGEFYHNSRSDEHGEFIVSNLFEAEARPGITPQDIEVISDKYSLKDFDEQGMFHGPPSVAPTTICNSASDHELDLIFEGYETSICKDKQSETVGCLESHESSKDEDWEFNISNLFDGERSARIKDSNKQVVIPDVPAISATCEDYNEVKFNVDGSNLQEISPSKCVGVSESQGQLKSPLADTTVLSIIQMPETCCNAIETAENAWCWSKTNIIGSSADCDAIDAECGKQIDDCSISKIGIEETTDMKLQDTGETEEQSTNMLEKESKPVISEETTDKKPSQSWTEIELHNLFGTIFDNDTPGRNNTSSSQTEAANLTSTNKSISKSRDSLTKKEVKMEGEKSEGEKIKNKIVVLPTSFSEVLHAGVNVDMEENQLATPIKKDETGSHGRELDRTVISVIKCSGTKENVLTQRKSNDKDALSDNGEGITCEGLNEVESVEIVNISNAVLSEAEYGGCGASEEQLTENSVECLKETSCGASEEQLTENSVECLKETSCGASEEQLTEKSVECLKETSCGASEEQLTENSVECLKETSCGASEEHLSEKSVECLKETSCGASEEQLTENSIKCLNETNLRVEQDKDEKAIHLPESCPYEALGNDSKLTEINCISSSDSPRNSVQLEGCQDMLDTVLSQSISGKSRICHTTEGDMTRSGEAGFGLSDADLQRSKKSNHLTVCSEDDNILRETSVETSRGRLDEEVEKISVFGTSPCHFSKFLEYEEVTNQGDSVKKDNDLCGTNTWNEKDGNSRSSQNVSDDNLEGDHEKTEKASEESLAASMVQFSIPQLHFEQAEDFNIHTHNMADVPHSECTETLKESDVADTIKEYIDSESSLSMISDNSSRSFPIDETTHENAALSENNEDVAERFTNTEDEVEGSTANKPLVETKGFDVKQKQIQAEDEQNSSFKQLYSTAKKNARTILIHGTAGKVPATASMKENAPMCKSSNVGDLTTVRPAKRKALRDVRWK